MIHWLQQYADNDIVVVLAILVLFLGIGGAALYLTPRIAAWLDHRDKTHPGYYDGMLREDPALHPEKAEEDAGEALEQDKEEQEEKDADQ